MMRLPSRWNPVTGQMSSCGGNVEMTCLQPMARIYFSTTAKGRGRKLDCPKDQAKGADGKSMELQTMCAHSTMRVSTENQSLFLGNLTAPVYKAFHCVLVVQQPFSCSAVSNRANYK